MTKGDAVTSFSVHLFAMMYYHGTSFDIVNRPSVRHVVHAGFPVNNPVQEFSSYAFYWSVCEFLSVCSESPKSLAPSPRPQMTIQGSRQSELPVFLNFLFLYSNFGLHIFSWYCFCYFFKNNDGLGGWILLPLLLSLWIHRWCRTVLFFVLRRLADSIFTNNMNSTRLVWTLLKAIVQQQIEPVHNILWVDIILLLSALKVSHKEIWCITWASLFCGVMGREDLKPRFFAVC